MRVAEVIGTVTLNRRHPGLPDGSYLIAVPYSLKALKRGTPADGEDVVAFDQLGAGTGCKIGISEGREAAMPFHPEKKPLDAYCACILDRVVVQA